MQVPCVGVTQISEQQSQQAEPAAAWTQRRRQQATPEAEAKRKQEEDQHQRREADAPRKQDEAKRLERRTAWCDEAVAVRRKPLPLARRSSGVAPRRRARLIS